MYQITKFAGITLPNYDTNTDIGSGEARLRLHDLPEGGAYDEMGLFDHATAGAQIITKSCTAQYDTESALLAALRTIRTYVGVQETLVREVLATGDEEWCTARCKKIDMVRKSGDKYMLGMTFHFAKLSPVWYGDVHAESENLVGGDVQNNLVFANNGNGYIDNAIITLTAGTNAITNAIIRHTTVGGSIFNELVYSGTINPGQELVIDCGAYTVELNGVNVYQNFSLGASHREVPWFRLWGTPTNYVKVILTGAGGTDPAIIELDYYDGWK